MSTAAAPLTLGFLKPRVSNKQHTKVKGQDILSFFGQLTTLFRAGTPLLEGLNIAADQTESLALRDIIRSIATKVASGAALYQALGAYPKHFKTEWLQVLKSGEESGQLGEVLKRLTQQMDHSAQLQSKIVSALMYPAVIAVVAVAAVIVMLVKVVPTFATMFAQFEKALPAITQGVLDLSEFLQAKGLYIVAAIALVVFGVRRYIETPGGRELFHKLLVSLPMVGDITVQACMQRFASNVALLIRAGLPLLDAIESMKGIFENNVVYQAAMHRIQRQVGSGGGIASALEQTGLFTSFTISMTRIGEDSGALADVLEEVEEFYARKLESVVERITGVLETVVILGMGITVAVILCAVYLPLFSMASGVG